jgi:predicted lipoprotein with Yx(FWY)xxD motif
VAFDAKGRVDMVDMASTEGTVSGHRSGRASTQFKGTGIRAGRAIASGAVAGLTLASTGLVLAGAPGLAGASHAKVVKVGTAKVAHVGTVLTTGTGLTLYWFEKDPAGQSTCSGGCATLYPPYLAAKGSHIQGPKGVKGLSLINVGSGHWQVAFDHAALYRFEGDKKKGQAMAQGAVGLWFAALKSGIKPAGAGGAAGNAGTVPTSTSTTGAHGSPTTQAPPAPQGGPPPTMPAPTTTPTTASPPPTTTPTTSPPTTTTTVGAGGGGGGVGF